MFRFFANRTDFTSIVDSNLKLEIRASDSIIDFCSQMCMFGSPVRKIDFTYMFSSTSRGIRIESGGVEIIIDSSMFGCC